MHGTHPVNVAALIVHARASNEVHGRARPHPILPAADTIQRVPTVRDPTTGVSSPESVLSNRA
jgi:hypothetical protein